jgi:hypothetical protein
MAAFKIKKEPTKIVEVRMENEGQLSMPNLQGMSYIRLRDYDKG